MVAAYRDAEGRPRHHIATNLILFGGWHVRYTCNHVGIHRCYPVK